MDSRGYVLTGRFRGQWLTYLTGGSLRSTLNLIQIKDLAFEHYPFFRELAAFPTFVLATLRGFNVEDIVPMRKSFHTRQNNEFNHRNAQNASAFVCSRRSSFFLHSWKLLVPDKASPRAFHVSRHVTAAFDGAHVYFRRLTTNKRKSQHLSYKRPEIAEAKSVWAVSRAEAL